MQEAAVFTLFFAVIGYFIYRRFFGKKSTGCSSCEFNPED